MKINRGSPIPNFRSFDEGKTLDWQPGFKPDTPLYMQMSLNNCGLHDDKKYRHARPGYQVMPWGITDMPIDEPSRNKVFFIPRGQSESFLEKNKRLILIFLSISMSFIGTGIVVYKFALHATACALIDGKRDR